MSLVNIKGGIKTKLDALVSDGVLAGATSSDFKKDPLAADIPSYPHAFLMPAAIASAVLDNHTNVRTYSFPIMVIFNGENITTATDVETKVEAILNKFENDPTLAGLANAGVEPIASAPQPLQHQSGKLIFVIIEIESKETISLNFA